MSDTHYSTQTHFQSTAEALAFLTSDTVAHHNGFRINDTDFSSVTCADDILTYFRKVAEASLASDLTEIRRTDRPVYNAATYREAETVCCIYILKRLREMSVKPEVCETMMTFIRYGVVMPSLPSRSDVESWEAKWDTDGSMFQLMNRFNGDTYKSVFPYMIGYKIKDDLYFVAFSCFFLKSDLS